MADSASAPSPASMLKGLGVAAVAGGFLALSGAFGSDRAPLILRLAYWISLMVIGGLWGHLCATIISRRFDIDRRPWLAAVLLTGAISAPLTVVVWAMTGVIFGPGPQRFETLPQFLLPVTLVTAAMTVLNIFLRRAAPVSTHAAVAGAPPARFPERLPPRLRGASLLAVQAEDHYLRVHTDRGSDLILMRMSDALAELEGLEGAQTHRSWWVARDAVRDVARGDGRAILTLTGGLTVPVSRRHARALREAGWY